MRTAPAAVCLCAGSVFGQQIPDGQSLPDAPSSLLESAEAQAASQSGTSGAQSSSTPAAPAGAVVVNPKKVKLAPCTSVRRPASPEAAASQEAADVAWKPCRLENPLQSIVSTPDVKPLNSKEKFHLAVHDVKDPFNLIVLTASSGITVATNAHGPNGPGLKGFGKTEGYNLSQDATGEFFATFAIPALTHEDPRYHRMGGSNVPKRVLHAVAHTWVSQHDNGTLMPNYAILGTFFIAPNISALYVPGAATSETTIVKGAALGLLANPTGDIIGEFLPDVAKHIHLHFYIAQKALQQITGQPNTVTP